ncbi:hypothetical protein EV188_10189 [Actinomycetospora succinea]|uniref:YokE-like PH domain-containing protein n=1 Tax=Actinomycetospora succinea TaxID=663603 RepID=A0A4R6VNH7_9PSEU|nr:hypothetical protein [Actinomycetospora succinea]TDQ64841.1 hypothetical protein EV188_10189 [Actinomycetospora succinea]
MGTHRQSSSRVIGVHSLPTAVISLIKEQAAVRGLYRDPLPEVTHAVRTELVTGTTGWFGRGREKRRATELLLTPDVLVVTDRDPDAPDADAQVTFHRLNQLEVARVELGLELVGTPVGATERGARVVETDGGPEIDRFHRALLEASEDSRRVDVPASRFPAESESVSYSPEFH